jgi:Pao retrotransposon peptidase/Protein of unknown function (DUF1759)/Family of unknown function (DUF5641)/Putative peptidase (DUF1758)/Integrase zinc binding domain
LELNKFNGDYKHWHTFYNTFCETINKTNCSKIEKMHHLINTLEGEARRVVSHLSVTAENYEDAIKMLQNRFENQRRITTSFMEMILELPQLQAKNSSSLIEMHDKIMESLLNLEKLNYPVQQWDALLVTIILKKFDYETAKAFEETLQDTKIMPTMKTVLEFLNKRYDTLESIKINKKVATSTSEQRPEQKTKPKQALFSTTKECAFCKNGHQIHECDEFKALSLDSRKEFVITQKLCRICLKHYYKGMCRSNQKCSTCGGRHHTLLHEKTAEKSKNIERKTKSTHAAVKDKLDEDVLLATAIITVKNSVGNFKPLRALIDSGSQVTMITEAAAQKLCLKRSKIETGLIGMCKSDAGTAKQQLNIEIKPHFYSTFCLNTNALIRDQLTVDLPTNPIKLKLKFSDIILADPTFKKPGKIDLVIGADNYGKIIQAGLLEFGEGLIAQDSHLGWIISGPIPAKENVKVTGAATKQNSTNQIEQLLENFKEEIILDSNDAIEKNFQRTTTRQEDGRYVVQIPFKKHMELGVSRESALARFFTLERKFDKNPSLKKRYSQFIKEYEDLGHMSKARHLEGRFYLPHHAVLKEESETTKLRVVFDGSHKSSNGKSLNDIMYKGPNLLENLMSLIMRWRTHKFVFSADVEKMFRQILIHPDDRKFQHILWRESTNEPIREYRMNTVTYGTSSASFLAIRTLKQLAEDEAENHSMAAKILEKDFYMDDCLSGADNIEEAKIAVDQLNQLLKKGGMNLRKWTSNNQSILEKLPDESKKGNLFEFNKNDVKMLGIYWNADKDYFAFKMQARKLKTTKRGILSEVASIYDPVGWLAPVTFKAKMFLQSLWEQKLDWDEQIPDKHKAEWSQFSSQLKKLEEIKIKRWIGETNNIQLVGFCDASENGYAAVIYAISKKSDVEKQVSLIAAKTRITSEENRQTIPRQELDGAVLLAELIKKVSDSFAVNKRLMLFTDSKVLLAWIKGTKHLTDPYVANRVDKIKEFTSAAEWKYVKSSENPADCATRGLNPEALTNFELWWHGPNWLKQSQNEWDTQEITKSVVVNLNICSSDNNERKNMFERYDSLKHQTRIFAFIKRFVDNCRNKEKIVGFLTTNELEAASNIIYKYAQEEFSEEIKHLLQNKPVPKGSKLTKLNPFIDDYGILRVGGRLQHAEVEESFKHPIIMPKHHVTNLIIEEEHKKAKHAGCLLTLNITRRKYWIIGGKAAVNAVLHKCILCLRFKTNNQQQLMGDLPAARVLPSPPFSSTGVDFAGPFKTRASAGRGIKSNKSYISVFVCMVTKAVHLELVSSLETKSFLAALRRFISRRGACSDIYSDNGTNFRGAANQLDKDLQEAIKKSTQHAAEKLANDKIKWHFIPPATPHFGGLWEAAVKSVKKLLRTTLAEKALTFEEFYTVLAEVEACLNSRPLTQLTNDPEDIDALTPGHFLIGRPLTAPPEKGVSNLSLNDRWNITQISREEIWEKWRNNYLTSLQERQKWQHKEPNLNIGELVLIKDEATDRLKWPLGRIQDISPGKDGLVRIASILTGDKTVKKRQLSKICKLPIDVDPTVTNPKKTNATLTQEKQDYVVNLVQQQKKNRKRTAPRIWMRTEPTPKIREVAEECLIPRKTTTKMTPWKKFGIFTTTILALTLATTPTTKAEENLTVFYPKTGLYLEELGEIELKRGQVRLDFSLNKSNILKDIENANQSVKNYDLVCDETIRLTGDQHCKGWSENNNNKLKHIINNVGLIMDAANSRSKRGIFGQILTAIFGVNDEVYKSLDDLEDAQNDILKKSAHQSNLLLSTVKDINSNTNKQISELSNKINHGFAIINDMQPWYAAIDKQRINYHMMAVSLDTRDIIDELSVKYEKILKALTQTGSMLDFITHHELQETITRINDKLPSDIIVEQQPNEKMETTFSADTIIIHGFLNLKETSKFKLFAATAIPERIKDNTFSAAYTVTHLVAIDYNRQRYFNTTMKDIEKCATKQQNIHLCSATSVYNLEVHSNCLIDYIINRNEIWTCDLQDFTISSPLWKQLILENTWLFIGSGTTRIAVICGESREEHNIKSISIIKVKNGCIIKTKDLTILSRQRSTLSVKGTYHMPMNFSTSIEKVSRTYHNVTHLTPIINIGASYIPKLTEEVTISHERTIKFHAVHHAVSAISTIIIVVILYLIWNQRTNICGILRRSPAKHIDQYQVSTEAPVAATRNQLSAPSMRYSIRPASPPNPEHTTDATISAATNREDPGTKDAPKPRRWEYV